MRPIVASSPRAIRLAPRAMPRLGRGTARSKRKRPAVQTRPLRSNFQCTPLALSVEVAVDPGLGIVRVRRVVGAYACGLVINPRLARSQCTGGMVGGVGLALMEQTLLNPRDGRPVNASMADYLVPVNLDVALDVIFVEEMIPTSIRSGLGEIALVGVAPAIANAVHNATGKRVRTLSIRI